MLNFWRVVQKTSLQLTLVMVASTSFCCADTFDPVGTLAERYRESLIYLSKGFDDLVHNEPLHASHEYRLAREALHPKDEVSHMISFMISFGEAVAYDCLGERAMYLQSIGSMCVSLYEYEKAVDSEEYESSYNFSVTPAERANVIEKLRGYILLSPSQEAQDLLEIFVQDLADDDEEPSFSLAEPIPLNALGWHFDERAFHPHLQDCSLKKEMKKWGKKTWNGTRHGAKKVKEYGGKVLKPIAAAVGTLWLVDQAVDKVNKILDTAIEIKEKCKQLAGISDVSSGETPQISRDRG